MTKAEKTSLQNLINKITEIRKQEDESFAELQDMARECELPVYCSAAHNRDQLIKIDAPYLKNGCNTTYARRANVLYDRYVSAMAKHDMIMELGSTLAELNFWK